MRDQRFVALHRGGLLTPGQHRLLIHWAIECSEHAILLLADKVDSQVLRALEVAREWESGKANVAAARKASVGAHAVARAEADPIAAAVARCCAQAVATAHMADHSIAAAEYALLAVKLSGLSVEEELAWQNGNLNPEIAERVLDLRKTKSWRHSSSGIAGKSI